MELVLSDDQRMIRDEATRLLGNRSTSARIREIVEGGDGHDAPLWATVGAELGWCAMAIPETHGGLGLGLTELALLLECTGRRLASLPLWSTVCLAAPLISAVATDAARAALLPRIAAGEAATVAWSAPGAVAPQRAVTIEAFAEAGGYLLAGRAPQVCDLMAAGIVLVPARLGDALALFRLDGKAVAGARFCPLETLDGTRQLGELTLDGCLLPTAARLDADGFGPADVDAATAFAQLGLAAEQVGAASGAMDATLAYISGRVQFGRTIASFQAVKHRCARLEVDLAEARALVHGAAAGFATAGAAERLLEAAAARALASDLLLLASEEAIQLHGGVGFTWEYDPHLYFKRAQASSWMLGAPHLHHETIAGVLLGGERAA